MIFLVTVDGSWEFSMAWFLRFPVWVIVGLRRGMRFVLWEDGKKIYRYYLYIEDIA